MSAVALVSAIVEHLNSPDRSFSVPFTAEQRVVPFTRAEQLTTVHVSVFVGTTRAELATRGAFLHTYKPIIAIQKRIVAATEAERIHQNNELVSLVEEIEQSLAELEISGIGLRSFDEEQDRDTYGIDALRSHGCFSTGIAVELMK